MDSTAKVLADVTFALAMPIYSLLSRLTHTEHDMTKNELTKILTTLHDDAEAARSHASEAAERAADAASDAQYAAARAADAKEAAEAAEGGADDAKAYAEEAADQAAEAQARCLDISEALSDLLHILREGGIAIEEAA